MDSYYCHKSVVPNKSCCRHYHSEFEIVYQLSGENITLIDGKEYHMKPSDVLVMPPNIPHEIPEGGEFTDLYFQTNRLSFDRVIKLTDISGELFTMLNLLNTILIDRKKYCFKMCENITECIELLIIQSSKIEHKYPFAEKLHRELNENISNCEFSVKTAIKKLGYNDDYMRRCFKGIYKKTPLEYLTEMRIKKAKSLLLQPCCHSVSEVAVNCGFYDPFYFSKCFKSICGVSPKEYRTLNNKCQ